MSIIASPETGVTPESEQPKAVTEALEYARAYEKVAEFLTANPDLAERADVYLAPYTNIYVSPTSDAIEFILDAAKRARVFGATAEEWADGKFGGVKILFGPLCIKVYAEVHRVCRRVVVGMVEDVQYALTFDLDGNPRKDAEVAAR